MSSRSPASMRISFTARWTGCSPARRRSRIAWRAAIWRTGSCALRRLLLLFRGAQLPAGEARLFARWAVRHAADHLRAALRSRRRSVSVEVLSRLHRPPACHHARHRAGHHEHEADPDVGARRRSRHLAELRTRRAAHRLLGYQHHCRRPQLRRAYARGHRHRRRWDLHSQVFLADQRSHDLRAASRSRRSYGTCVYSSHAPGARHSRSARQSATRSSVTCQIMRAPSATGRVAHG